LHYFIAFPTHSSIDSSLLKDRVGDNIASNAISGEADDRIDDIQEGLSSGNSCEELQKDNVLVLCEDDIPGSSLNGRDPTFNS